jgi:hypothetical protein
METQVPFPKFIQALKDMGAAQIHGAAFLSDPEAAWRALDADLRSAYLLPLGMQDAPEVVLRIGKKAGGKKSLDDVLVIITGPEFVAPPRPDLAAPQPKPSPAIATLEPIRKGPQPLVVDQVAADEEEEPVATTAMVEATSEPLMNAPPSALDAAPPQPAPEPKPKKGLKGRAATARRPRSTRAR